MLRRPVTGILFAAEWLYGPRAAGFDVALGALAAGWYGLMIGRPEMFDRGSLLGLTWLPDAVWICLLGCLAGMHMVGLVRPSWRAWRVSAVLASSWTWLFVSLSLSRIELTTGVIAYGVIGLGAVFGGIYLASLPRAQG